MPDTPNPRKSLQQRALTSASASCCLLPTPPEPAVEMLTGKMGFLLPMPTSRQPSACGRSPGRSPAAERQEASVRPGRGTGPVYHNIPCRHLHCVQGSTLTKQISVLGPACMSCGLWVKETPSQGTSAAAVKGTPEAVQADTKAGFTLAASYTSEQLRHRGSCTKPPREVGNTRVTSRAGHRGASTQPANPSLLPGCTYKVEMSTVADVPKEKQGGKLTKTLSIYLS